MRDLHTAQLPVFASILLPPVLILPLVDLTRLQRAFGIKNPTPFGINDPAMKGREYKLNAVVNPQDA